jgi:hypothetical protein
MSFILILDTLSVTVHIFYVPNTPIIIPPLCLAVGWSWQKLDCLYLVLVLGRKKGTTMFVTLPN